MILKIDNSIFLKFVKIIRIQAIVRRFITKIRVRKLIKQQIEQIELLSRKIIYKCIEQFINKKKGRILLNELIIYRILELTLEKRYILILTKKVTNKKGKKNRKVKVIN